MDSHTGPPPQSPMHNHLAAASHPSGTGRDVAFQKLGLSTSGSPISASAIAEQDGQIQAEDAEPTTLSTPAWTELKTKAGKDRKRLPLACIACRRKKIRCSGEAPACKHCLKSRTPCVYKITTRKPAPRTDYMTMLDRRLKRMEERILKNISKEELKRMPGVARAVVKPSATQQNLQQQQQQQQQHQQHGRLGSKKRTAKEAFGAVASMNGPLSRQSVSSRLANNSSGRDSSKPLKSAQVEERSLMLEGAEHLPSAEIQQHLSEVYFDFVYCQGYPLLHKPSFIRRLAAGNVAPVLMLAICAISARFSNSPDLDTEPPFLRGEAWANAAMEISLRRFESPNLTVLMVYLLLGLHEFGTCRGGRSWMYGGMAQRMAYALQLHKDLDHDPLTLTDGKPTRLSPIDREIRRRVMWSCFLMDRFNSSGTDRPMFAQEQYLSLQLPLKESLFIMEIPAVTENLQGKSATERSTLEMSESLNLSDAKSNMGACAYTIRIVAIWGRFVQYFNIGAGRNDNLPLWSPDSSFQQNVRELQALGASLPPNLTYSRENLETHASENIANQFLYLHIVYHQAILFAHRFAFPATSVGPMSSKVPLRILNAARVTALDAAAKITALIAESDHYRLVVPFVGYSSYLSSAVHIHGAFSSDTQLAAASSQRLAINFRYLTKMKKCWGMFHFLAESLKDIWRQYADMVAVGGPGTPAIQAQSKRVFQYGDWYDRFPHGLSKSDYEEPEAEQQNPDKAEIERSGMAQKSDLQSVEEFFTAMAANRAAGKGKRGLRRKGSRRGGGPSSPTTTRPPKGRPTSGVLSTSNPLSGSAHESVHSGRPGRAKRRSAGSQVSPANQQTEQGSEFGHRHQMPASLNQQGPAGMSQSGAVSEVGDLMGSVMEERAAMGFQFDGPPPGHGSSSLETLYEQQQQQQQQLSVTHQPQHGPAPQPQLDMSMQLPAGYESMSSASGGGSGNAALGDGELEVPNMLWAARDGIFGAPNQSDSPATSMASAAAQMQLSDDAFAGMMPTPSVLLPLHMYPNTGDHNGAWFMPFNLTPMATDSFFAEIAGPGIPGAEGAVPEEHAGGQTGVGDVWFNRG